MSDSEGEATYASADEGEGVSATPAMESKKELNSTTTDVKETKGSEKGKNDTPTKSTTTEKSKSDTAASAPEPAKKGTGKQQPLQRGKKKGKGGGQMSQREATVTKPDPKELQSAQKAVEPAVEVVSSTSKTDMSELSKSEVFEKNHTKNDSATEGKESPQSSPKKEIGTKNKESSKTEDKVKEKLTDEVSRSLSPLADEKSEEKGSSPKSPFKKDVEEGEGDDSVQTVQAGEVRSQMTSPEGQAISPELRDHHKPQDNVLKKLEDSAQQSSDSGGWGWGSWGSSLISVASNSVQTFTHQVGDGLTTIMDSVESSLGVTDPEQLVEADITEEPNPGQLADEIGDETRKPEESPNEQLSEAASTKLTEKVQPSESTGKLEESGGGWFGSWGMADLAKKVQDTGKSLATKGQTLMSDGFDAVENLAAGGIDVLETIGKKTYTTLSEHDPAFRKTRKYLSAKRNKPNLSSVLREAKDQAEQMAEFEKESEEARKAHFGTLFDDYQGIAHLEALEMLSNQSEKKVHSLLNSLASEDLKSVKPSLIAIKEAFEVEDEDTQEIDGSKDDFTSLVGQCVSEIQLGTAPDKLNKVHDIVKQWIHDFDAHDSHDSQNIKTVHQRGIQALAELASKGVEQFHKAGELVLMERDKDKDCTERAHSLARLTGVLCHEVANLSTSFAGCLNKIPDQESGDVTTLVTNIYLEASNSSTYLQDAFQLLLPVLQHAALEHFILKSRPVQL